MISDWQYTGNDTDVVNEMEIGAVIIYVNNIKIVYMFVDEVVLCGATAVNLSKLE